MPSGDDGRSEPPRTFAALLREYRLRAGFSQEYLAERARMSVVAIGLLERGARRSSYRATVELLA
jgi:transcriptional regulator with XRE-family HTH domain